MCSLFLDLKYRISTTALCHYEYIVLLQIMLNAGSVYKCTVLVILLFCVKCIVKW